MSYKRYKMLQKYINGEPQEEYKQGELISNTEYSTLEECNDGNQNPDTPIEGEIYQWVTISGEYVCSGYDKYTKEKEQRSSDNGATWTDTGRTRQGSLMDDYSEDCGYVPTVETRWVAIEGQYECVGYDKHTKEKKQQSTDGGNTWTDVVPTETRTGSVIEYNSEDCGYVPPSPDPSDYSTQYLTIEALTGGDIGFQTSVVGSYDPTYISYSRDNGQNWYRIQAEYNTINIGTLAAGEKILFKGNNTHYANVYQSGYRYCFLKFTGRANVYGNIMSLIYNDNFVGETTLTEDLTFYRFFFGNFVDAQNLILPATTLTTSCYEGMFGYCTSLTTAPALPATTLANGCYNSMFYDCTSLTTAPELPARTLASGCYRSMFRDCTNLNYIKAMFTTTPSNTYTYNWVNGVASSGTFVKNASATWNVTGNNGIPEGWNVING